MRLAFNVSLPASIRTWIDEQAERRGYSTASEFIRSLIVDEQAREMRDKIDAKLLTVIRTSEAREMTRTDWKNIERRVFSASKKARHKK